MSNNIFASFSDPLRTVDRPAGLPGTGDSRDISDPNETSAFLSASTDDPNASVESTSSFQLPGYEVLGVLGRGGMGIVYKARQIAANRVVALKMILRGEHASASDLLRFQREAEAVAQLSHPNIVHIYEVGTHQGLPYFTLEYVAGGNLAQQLAGNPQPALRSAELVEQLARAMHHAHQNGIVHRDLKPGNILLTNSAALSAVATRNEARKTKGLQAASTASSRSDGAKEQLGEELPPTPKITDFGLARQLEAEHGQTNSGAIMGTPSYMAPEQALGLTRHVGPAADIYALGAILYECFTGLPPFKGASQLETLDQVRHRDPMPVRQLQPSIPRDLETICLKCLAKDPAKRYPSAGELANDLRRYLDGKPIVARPVGLPEQAWKWIRRNPEIAMLMTVIFLGLIVGITWISIIARKEAIAHQAATQNEITANMYAEEVKGTLIELAAESQEVRRQKALVDDKSAVSSVLLAQGSWEARDTAPDTAFAWLEDVPPEQRRWEWYYLNRSFEGSKLTLTGHTTPVINLEFSRDGTRLLSTSTDRLILWDCSKNEPLASWYMHKGSHDVFRAGSIRPDGNKLATCSLFSAGIIDIDTKNDRALADADVSRYARVKYNLDGTVLAAITDDPKQGCQFHLRDPDDGRFKREWQLAGHEILDWCFGPDGQQAALAGSFGNRPEIVICNYRTGLTRLTINPKTLSNIGQVKRIAWSSDGTRIACMLNWTAAEIGGARMAVFDAIRGEEIFSTGILIGDAKNSDIAISPDGLLVGATGSSGVTDYLISLWNLQTGRLEREIKGHLSSVTSLTFSPDGSRLISGDESGIIKCWELQSRAQCLGTRGSLGRAICTRKDGVYAAMVRADNRRQCVLDLWNLMTGKKERSWVIAKDFAGAVCYTPDGKYLVSAGGVVDDYGEIRVWDPTTGVLVSEWRTSQPCISMAFSADGRILVTSGANLFSERSSANHIGELKVWDFPSGRLLHNLSPEKEWAAAVAFHPHRNEFVSAVDTGFTIWDAVSGQPKATTHAHDSPIGRVLYSPDGKYIVTASSVFLRLWSAEDGQWIAELSGHQAMIRALEFSPDGQRLVSSDARRMVRVWDLGSRKQLLNLTADGEAMAMAFGTDNCLLAALMDGRIQVWLAPAKSPVIRLEGHRFDVHEFSFSRDGNYLASGNKFTIKDVPTELKIWDTASGKLLHNLSGLSNGGIGALAFNPTATLLAAGNQRNEKAEIVIWDVGTGEIRNRISDPDGISILLHFSEDGNRLISRSSRGLKAWDATTGEVVPRQPGDELEVPKMMTDDQRFVAARIDNRIILLPRYQATPLAQTLGQYLNTSNAEYHFLEMESNQKAGKTFAAWFHAEQTLLAAPAPVAELYRRRDELLVAAHKQYPNHVEIGQSLVRLMVANPKIAGKPDDYANRAFGAAVRSPSALTLRNLAAIALRKGQPDDAIPPLKMALELREPNAVPVEELLLALAHQQKNQLGESNRLYNIASKWYVRERVRREAVVATCSGMVAFLPTLSQFDPDSRYRPSNWESWREMRALFAEVAQGWKK